MDAVKQDAQLVEHPGEGAEAGDGCDGASRDEQDLTFEVTGEGAFTDVPGGCVHTTLGW